MFRIILFIYFNAIFLHKKRFHGAVPRDCSWNHNFFCYLIRGCKQVLIWNIRFFPFLYNQSFCKLTEMSSVKSFSSCHTVFSTMQVLCSNFSANVMAIVTPIIHFGNFYLFKLTKVSFLIILLIDKRLIPVCSAILRGPRCVCGASSCGQIPSSVK